MYELLTIGIEIQIRWIWLKKQKISFYRNLSK